MFAVAGFVRADSVELALADRHVIEAQMRPHVLRKDEPRGGMRACRPRGEVAERLVVLSHKPLGIQEMSLGNRGQRQGLGVSLGLFKKPHTPLPVASRRQ